MPRLRQTLAASAASVLLAFGAAACGSSEATTAADQTTTTAQSTSASSSADSGPPAGGPGGGVSVDSASSPDDLVSLIEAAYGEPGLGLHRGHQDVESTLIEVLGISHDEMHVRMDAGQNLAAIAKDQGVDQQKLIDALVATRTPAIDALLEAGTITQAQADAYKDKLVDAYEFRVTWDGSAATPSVTAV